MVENHLSEPHVVCPKWSYQIPLTESLAAPLLEAERKHFRSQLDAKDAEYRQKIDEVRRKEEELAHARETIGEEIAQRLNEERTHIKAVEQKKAREAVAAELQTSRAQLAELQETMKHYNAKLAEAQQTQAEVLRKERELEAQKRELDLEFGGDIVQKVNAQIGPPVGTILWELKSTRHWSEGWLTKLREDQRNSKAEIALIISHALPKEIETFGLIDGVWVAHPRCAIPVAVALRHSLIELSLLRNAQVGQHTKMEQIYHYLTGPRFRQRLEGIVEKFEELKDDLDKERKFMNRIWAKREGQIQGVIETTVGMYSDLQGIAGKALPEIPSLDMPLLEAPGS